MRYPKRSQYKHAKSPYQVRNWATYEAGLGRRGELTVWLSDAALKVWRAPAKGSAGGQPIYSDLAMEAALTLRGRFGDLRKPESGVRAGWGLGEFRPQTGAMHQRRLLFDYLSSEIVDR